MKTCFLIGHRDVPEELRERLEKAIDEAIMRDGVTEFVVGQYGAFDRMAAGCLVEAKGTTIEGASRAAAGAASVLSPCGTAGCSAPGI